MMHLRVAGIIARPEIELAAGHPFDDEHGASADRTAQLSSDLGIACAGRCAEQNAATRESISAPPVGEESEVADANQSPGQNVDQESAQKLLRGNGHDLLLAAVRIVFPAKRDSIVLEGDESMVRDRDAMGIARQIVQNMLRTAERRLGVDDPVLLEKLSQKLCGSKVARPDSGVSRGTGACAAGRVGEVRR